MRRVTAAAVLVLFPVILAAGAAPHSDAQAKPLPSIAEKTNWMTELPGSRPMGSLSMIVRRRV